MQARSLLAAEMPPEYIVWSVADAQPSLFAPAASGAEPAREPERETTSSALMVPRAFVVLAADVAQHCEPQRFAILYRLLWRLAHGDRELLSISVDPEVSRAEAMAKAVRRDTHKMRAFVRFREVENSGQPWFLAWFQPDHYIVEANAPFFVRRFNDMCWSILTPYRSAHWDRTELRFGPGASRSDAPTEDALEGHWRAYYASVFNPARLNPTAMRSEMPKKYWHNLPEAHLIAPLIREASNRIGQMLGDSVTEPTRKGRVQVAPASRGSESGPAATLDELRQQAIGCRECPLWTSATQTVFGEGPPQAPVMLVGEQPGDQEDLAGRPFVGPAGKMLDRALADAAVARESVYVTNAVKHFKFTLRGKRRLHQKPDGSEIDACRHWLRAEIEFVRPRLLVALGATAAVAMFGRAVKIGETRGRLLPFEGRQALVTVHPSYILRLPDEAVKQSEYRRFVADLRLARDIHSD